LALTFDAFGCDREPEGMGCINDPAHEQGVGGRGINVVDEGFVDLHQNYVGPVPMPTMYPPAGYGPQGPMPGRSPRPRDPVEDLERHLERLEGELARVRENLAAIKTDRKAPE
jgi:hypothetical protein